MNVCIPTSLSNLLYLEDGITSCGNRTSWWLRHLTFPLPFLAPDRLSLFFLLLCVCSVWACVVRVRVRWQPASHCPIIPAPLRVCFLWCFLLWGREPQRNRGKRKAGKMKEWCRSAEKVWYEHRSVEKVLKRHYLNNRVCFPVFPWRIPCRDPLICSPLCRKGCVLWILMFASVTVMSLWFYKCAQNACYCFVGQNSFASLNCWEGTNSLLLYSWVK